MRDRGQPSARSPTRPGASSGRPRTIGVSRASRPATSLRRGGRRDRLRGRALDGDHVHRSASMAGDLLAEPRGDLAGELARRRGPRSAAAAGCPPGTRPRPGRAGWSAARRGRRGGRPRGRCGSRTGSCGRSACQIRSSSSWRMSRVMASSAPNGSSMSRTSASCASARASATRWRMPPESSCGWRLANGGELDHLEQLGDALPGAAPWAPCAACSGSSTLRSTLSHGNSAASWNMNDGSPGALDGAARWGGRGRRRG